MKKSLLILMFLIGTTALASEEAPQSLTLDGRLYSDASAKTPLLDTGKLKIQILDYNGTCVLYEEQQNFDTRSTDGSFNINVGEKASGSAKRTAGDSGNTLAKIFANSGGTISGKLLANGSACSGNATPGFERSILITVIPDSDPTPRTMTAFSLNSVPSAIAAERAESLEGIKASGFLQIRNIAPYSLSQSNVENIFSTANYTKLTDLLGGASDLYVHATANGTILAPSISGTPSSPAAGQLWYDSGSVKFWDGSSVQTLASGSGITSLTIGTGLTPTGTITAGGSTIAVDVGTSAGQIVQVQAGGKLPALNGSDLTGVVASGLSGTASISTTGTISSGAITSSSFFSGTETRSNSVKIFKPSTSNYVELVAPASLSAPVTYTLPDAAPGVAGYVLSSNTSGVLSWVAQTPAGLSAVSNSASLADGKIWIGDSGGKAQEQTLSGDATVSNTGVLALKNTGTAGTYKSVTTDAQGRVTAGTNPTTLSGFGITDAVSNAGGSLSIQSGADASKGAAATAGRIYFATDTSKIYRDNGTTWDTIASNSGTGISALTGDVTASGTGSVAATVARIQGVGVSVTSPTTTGQVLKYNSGGTQYAPGFIGMADIRSSQPGNAQFFPASACGAGQTLSWQSGTDTLVCSDITLPTSKLSGSVDLTTQVTGTLPVANGGTGVTSLPGTFVLNGGQPGAVVAGTSDATSLTLRTNNAARVTIDSAGLVGIGTTTPGHALSVVGDIYSSTGTFRSGTNNTYSFTSSGNFKLDASAGGAGELAYRYGGGGGWYHSFYTGSSSTVPGLKVRDNGIDAATTSASVNPLQVFENSNLLMMVKGNGNVGIGTNNPADKLQVEGKIRATHICAADGTNCKDLAGSWGAGGSVTDVTAGTGLTGGTISTSGTIGLGTELAAVNALSTTGFVKRTGAGAYSTATSLSLTADVTGVLPVANGGTNSATALNNDRLMISSGGAIVESAAMTDGQFVVGKTGAAPQQVTMSGDATVSNTGAVTLKNTGTAGTYAKVTTDAQGRVTSGTTLSATDIPNLDWAKITTGKPTTLSGYGITDSLVVNGGGTPSFTSGVDTSKPAAGTAGRIYIATDTFRIYRDNGTTWDMIASAAGTGLSAVSNQASLANGKMWLGDGSGKSQEQTMSGDATITNAGVLALKNTGTAGTYAKVTTDAQGRVTSGTTLSASDIPNLDWAKITTGTPTTLSGYGITNGVVNAGNTVSIESGLDASKPTAGTAGRVYLATDTSKVYRDNGTSWDTIASNSGTGISALTGDVTASGTGSVAATVANVGGVTAANVASGANAANAATNNNTVSTIVKRDSNGDFSARDVSLNSLVLRGSTSGTLTQKTAAATTSYTVTWPSAVPGVAGYVLSSDTSGNLSWIAPTTGSLTAVSNSANLALGKIWIGDGTGKAQENSISGDITLSSSGSTSVTKVQGVAVSSTSPTVTGQILKYNTTGTQYEPGFIGISDIRSTVAGNAQFFPTSCTAGQTLVWQSGTDTMVCTNISVPTSQVTGTLPVANGGTGVTSLPGTFVLNGGQAGAVSAGTTDATDFTLKTNNVTRLTIASGGNIGIGTASPVGIFQIRHNPTNQTINLLNTTYYSSTTTNGAYDVAGYSSVVSPKVNAGITNSGKQFGASFTVLRNWSTTGDNGSLSDLIGLDTTYGHYGSDATATPIGTSVYGLRMAPYTRSGSVTDMYDIYIMPDNQGGGTPTTITNRYAIYQANVGSKNFFAGDIGIGVLDPTYGASYFTSSRILSVTGKTAESVNSHGVVSIANDRPTPSNTDILGFFDFISKNGAGSQKIGARIQSANEGSGGANGFGASLRLQTKADDGALSERMRINSAGNVGIGTTSPAAKLDVNGQIKGGFLSHSSLNTDWAAGNIQTTSAAAGTLTFTSGSMLNGASYVLILTSAGTFTLDTSGDVTSWKCLPACTSNQVVATGHTVLTIIKAGSVGYLSWGAGFQ